MILTRGVVAAEKMEGCRATMEEKKIYAILRRRMNAPDKHDNFLAVGGPFDGKLLWLPAFCEATMISRWRGSNGQWYGHYSQYNKENLPKPGQVGHGRPCLYWRNKEVPLLWSR